MQHAALRAVATPNSNNSSDASTIRACISKYWEEHPELGSVQLKLMRKERYFASYQAIFAVLFCFYKGLKDREIRRIYQEHSQLDRKTLQNILDEVVMKWYAKRLNARSDPSLEDQIRRPLDQEALAEHGAMGSAPDVPPSYIERPKSPSSPGKVDRTLEGIRGSESTTLDTACDTPPNHYHNLTIGPDGRLYCPNCPVMTDDSVPQSALGPYGLPETESGLTDTYKSKSRRSSDPAEEIYARIERLLSQRKFSATRRSNTRPRNQTAPTVTVEPDETERLLFSEYKSKNSKSTLESKSTKKGTRDLEHLHSGGELASDVSDVGLLDMFSEYLSSLRQGLPIAALPSRAQLQQALLKDALPDLGRDMTAEETVVKLENYLTRNGLIPDPGPVEDDADDEPLNLDGNNNKDLDSRSKPTRATKSKPASDLSADEPAPKHAERHEATVRQNQGCVLSESGTPQVQVTAKPNAGEPFVDTEARAYSKLYADFMSLSVTPPSTPEPSEAREAYSSSYQGSRASSAMNTETSGSDTFGKGEDTPAPLRWAHKPPAKKPFVDSEVASDTASSRTYARAEESQGGSNTTSTTASVKTAIEEPKDDSEGASSGIEGFGTGGLFARIDSVDDNQDSVEDNKDGDATEPLRYSRKPLPPSDQEALKFLEDTPGGEEAFEAMEEPCNEQAGDDDSKFSISPIEGGFDTFARPEYFEGSPTKPSPAEYLRQERDKVREKMGHPPA